MKRTLQFLFFFIFTGFVSCSTEQQKSTGNQCIDYVDTYIGTGGHGHTFLGVTTPFGAVQLGPGNFNKGWDWCSGYHYSDSIVIGFAHLHLSGTGCSDTGDILFMPYTGEKQTQPGSQDNPDAGYASRYSHDSETARPAYYSVQLDDYNIKVELTATERVGFHQYTFPDDVEEKHIIINLKDANGDDRPVETFLEQTDRHTIRGYRFSTGWSKAQEVFFTAIFSEPVQLELYDDNEPKTGSALKSAGVKGILSFDKLVKQMQVKVGLSPVSMENAQKNIEAEIPAFNFDEIVNQTNGKWNRELSKINIETPDPALKRTFYTAMYHAFIAPNLFNDHHKDYRGADKKVYTRATFNNYTVFSLWDTYRAAHPLYTLVQPERVPDFIQSMLAIFDQTNCLPVWHLYGSDTKEMIGIQSVPVIADAIHKGFSFDYEKAYHAMKTSMLSDYKGLNFVREMDYIPADEQKESVAKGLEYAIADWGIAQTAKQLKKEEDFMLFSKRAKNYRYYWDNTTHFFRGKTKAGLWTEPFNPIRSSHRNDDYCEGNGWQYTWLVPQDVEGLIGLFGSGDAFVNKLDSLFVVEGDMGDETSPDISGLIGQYAHGNEPGHHTIYLYAFAGQQWKTAEKARYILTKMYKDQPNGLDGNEDCGQMSSWYIFSALGFYPVNPSNGVYVFGSPLFDKATLSLPGNKTFEIETVGNKPENMYIQSVEFNGQPYTKSFITHQDIMQGGKITFVMGSAPNKTFGAAPEDRPINGKNTF